MELTVKEALNKFPVNLTKLGKIIGINERQLGHYKQGAREPSPETIEKIQKGLNILGAELKELKLKE
ncbi:helix-turn-helix domain-containing protein [Xanthovirga aplysinae]|uniref:helix-turn-helix domain-containing protein n=1 Tax=Xanthovirga aplysinae TaxID=2529853 RepID=UPI0012BC2ADB|nr:helix-turn-helix transcriptional regulator [Xanthovirga aplysinae]MTI31422.1 XRE family transcriptional regulator [Xanthovirga aplysinae]